MTRTRVYTPTDPRLGRHCHHDDRSLAYAHGVLPRSAIKSVQWTTRIPVLDQGQLGSCTGNAITNALGTDSAGRTAPTSVTVKADKYGIFKAGSTTLDEAFAVKAYEVNTRLDSYSGQYPPTDTGSDGISAAKTAQALGLVTGYTHAFSVSALVSALQTGPVLFGTPWYESMYDPGTDGYLAVDPASGTAGGHELCITGYNAGADVYAVVNSWGASWGVNGMCFVNGSDMAVLLADDGDITVPTFATVPVPVPPAVIDDAALWATAKAWAAAKGFA